MTRPVIIDCDTGRDDALTLWLALRMGLALRAVVCSYGNTPLPNVVENSLRVLSLVPEGRAIPVWVGADKPTNDHALYRSVVLPRQGASGNGLCNIVLPSTTKTAEPLTPSARAEAVLELAAREGPVDYVVIGPSTNLAHMLACLSPADHAALSSVTFMAGKVGALWDENPALEFNVACDPFALKEIMETDLRLRFVPMNATWPIALSLAEVEGLKPLTDLAGWAREIMLAHCRHFAPEPVFRFHDPTVLWAMSQHSGWRLAQIALDAEESSTSFGQVTECQGGRPIELFETTRESYPLIRKTLLSHLGFEEGLAL